MIVAGLVCQVAFFMALMWYGETTEGRSRHTTEGN